MVHTMTGKHFVSLYMQPDKKVKPRKINSGLVETTKSKSEGGVVELNKGHYGKKGCVTAADAYGPTAGAGDSACDCGPACDGGACACGESISPKTFVACLESLSSEYPESPVVSQIMNMFKAMQQGAQGKLYAAADGYESDDSAIQDNCKSDADTAISAAAASCAAALETFRAIAGYDYFDYNK